MPERGAPPKVPKLQRQVLRAARALSSPLLPDDYLELINPLWSTRELRGRIESIRKETDDAVTVVIRPGYEWEGHRPGQYLRVGIDVDGVRHWRAYSLTSDPDDPNGYISITPKYVESGVVSPVFVRENRIGTLVGLGGVEGDFILPDVPPDRLLFISAGCGITPIMSMLRHLDRRDALRDVRVVHSARHPDDVIFGPQLREMDRRNEGFSLHEQHTGRDGRIGPEDLDDLCSDWREREAYVSGPGDLLDALSEHWEQEGDEDRLHLERFQPKLATGEVGKGGTIQFTDRDCEAVCDGATPILVAGEEQGLDLPYGCREGICHTCVGTLESGQIRDLRTGKVTGQDGQQIRTCIHAPEGPIEISV